MVVASRRLAGTLFATLLATVPIFGPGVARGEELSNESLVSSLNASVRVTLYADRGREAPNPLGIASGTLVNVEGTPWESLAPQDPAADVVPVLALTNAHVVELLPVRGFIGVDLYTHHLERAPAGFVTVVQTHLRQVRAELLDYNQELVHSGDVGVLRVKVPRNLLTGGQVKPVDVMWGNSKLTGFQPLWVVGCGNGTAPAWRFSWAAQITAQDQQFPVGFMSGSRVTGDSGGGLFDESARLVGITTGTSPTRVALDIGFGLDGGSVGTTYTSTYSTFITPNAAEPLLNKLVAKLKK